MNEKRRVLTPEQRAAAVERTRKWRLDNPGRRNETEALWRERNRDKERARHRKYKAENLEKERERARRISRQNWMTRHHGPAYADVFAAMWQAQDGQCYLCRREMDPKSVSIDHDHRCCPKNSSCSRCRRGLACTNCNILIGHAGDDPERLRLIAGNLEAALAAFESRPQESGQMELPDLAQTTAGYAAVNSVTLARTVNAIPAPVQEAS